MARHKEASTRGPSKGWTGAGITQMAAGQPIKERRVGDGTWTGASVTGVRIRQMGPVNWDRDGVGPLMGSH